MNILDSFSLKGKVAIVTGGYGNLGSAMTDALLEAGAKVVVAGHNKKSFDKLYVVSDTLDYVEINILDSQSIKKGLKQVHSKWGHIDVIVNNATCLDGQMPEEITDEQLEYSFNGILGSAYKMMRESIPYLEETRGNIINIASMYGIVVPDFELYEGVCKPYFNPPQYGAAKAGVIQLTKYFAEYLAPRHIRVNSISPGTFPSKEIQKNSEFVRRLAAKNPAKRIGTPEDLKGTVVFLASDASNYLIGQNLQVDGGWTIW